ncbi:unnamed protein product [Didymodactylos carnosus]|uniref:Paired amphipathic helix protein Sin3b n=1 Tax=Didymodactylos carnosus TaxID=1234261 RepID=A0A814DWI1_9BILA|nr:unnamed protein product [Didymodactylos carnosus]CAF0961360.1 unnamed protein product [Didymodactylos carnosus]CAF3567505.1 unnamed protein product [Didymodactylos carnosus]CAF3735807.1 unnamed protein product [Didymodactylos carnosus]
MIPTSSNSSNLGLNSIVSTLVNGSSNRPSPQAAAAIVSSLQNSPSPVHLLPNITAYQPGNQPSSISSRLKVEDALNYLDKVKNQFSLQPQVYNQFLDIMKEFKSQSIDTQEVINRVSRLFHGHPDLIVGFNTFLPPGYKIEVSDDHPSFIQVTHPSSRTESITIGGNGTTTTNYSLCITTPNSATPTYHSNIMNTINLSSRIITSPLRQTANLLLQQDEDETTVSSFDPLSTTNSFAALGQVTLRPPTPCAVVPSIGSSSTSQAVNALISAATSSPTLNITKGKEKSQQLPSQQTNTPTSATSTTPIPTSTSNSNSGQPVEFNHAINYVNKIKNRFHQQPDIYKHFLEILHTYQKQQKDAKEYGGGNALGALMYSSHGGSPSSGQTPLLSETEVYAKVAQLFTNHEDLLVEFSQFLPDATQQPMERTNSISDILSSSGATPPAFISTPVSTIPKIITNNPVSSASILSTTTTTSTISSSFLTTAPNITSTTAPSTSCLLTPLTSLAILSSAPSFSLASSLSTSTVIPPIVSSLTQAETIARPKTPTTTIANTSSASTIVASTKRASTTSQRQTPTNTSTNKSTPSSKRPASSKPLATVKKKRLSLTNIGNGVNIGVSGSNTVDSTGQVKKMPTIDEVAFFDKVQKTLRSPLVFDNFLRCILLFTKRIITKVELVELIQSYLGHFPELLRTFQELINIREPGEVIIPKSISDPNDGLIDIDYSSCTQQGTSYRAVPKSYSPPQCSGRTPLCREVLNDTCVLFPTFTDESSSVAAKKTVFEEHMYKIEDERFELDIVMEVNLSTIRALESVQMHMNTMTQDQLNTFQLGEELGGQSAFTQRQAIQRIYGERANEIIDGLKRNPRVAVPIVLRRLKSKDEEWREAKKNFERFWKEQSEKFYLKSLDHMGINCKNNDARIIRNRHLLNEIENVRTDREQQFNSNITQPHLSFRHEDLSILDDAASLIVFLVKRQVGFGKEDKQKIKEIMYQFLPDFLFSPRGDLSDDEEDDEDEEPENNNNNNRKDKKSRPMRHHTDANRRRNTESVSKPKAIPQQTADDMYRLFLVNDNWYYFFRLHQLLCERLLKIYQQSLRLIEQESKELKDNSNNRNRTSTATLLRLSNKPSVPVEEFYITFLDMVRNLLDGNMDGSSYEDSLRDMFGIHAYIAFTMDKIIHNCVRQLHSIVQDEASVSIMDLYLRNIQLGVNIGLVDHLFSTSQQNSELSYQKEIEPFTDNNRFFRICSYKNDRRVTTTLIVIDSSDDEEDEKTFENWSRYIDNYLQTNNNTDENLNERIRIRLRKKSRFLLRNLRKSSSRSDSVVTKQENEEQPQTNITPTTTEQHNNDYCIVERKNLKRTPYHKAGFTYYKRGALRAAKQCHKRVSVAHYERFSKFYKKWVMQNIPDNNDDDADDEVDDNTGGDLCLETYHRPDAGWADEQVHLISSITGEDNFDVNRPPYRPYRRYMLAGNQNLQSFPS